MLPFKKFAEDKVLVFVILREKCKNSATLSKSNLNPNANFQSKLIR